MINALFFFVSCIFFSSVSASSSHIARSHELKELNGLQQLLNISTCTATCTPGQREQVREKLYRKFKHNTNETRLIDLYYKLEDLSEKYNDISIAQSSKKIMHMLYKIDEITGFDLDFYSEASLEEYGPMTIDSCEDWFDFNKEYYLESIIHDGMLGVSENEATMSENDKKRRAITRKLISEVIALKEKIACHSRRK